MKCAKPFRQGVEAFGCGQCMPCRVNRRRLWTARLMLEASQHQACSFVTLTYDKEHLPCNGSLRPRDLQLFLKRLRKLIAPAKLRYYAVGEYGDITSRPHYHLALFGVDSLMLVRQAWSVDGIPLGLVHCGTLTQESAAYIVSYVVKRLTSTEDARLAEGQEPEFARMSLRPGLGAGAVDAFVNAVSARGVSSRYRVGHEVPSTFRTAGKFFPLGRYLRRKITDRLGLADGRDLVVPHHVKAAQLEAAALGTAKARALDESKRAVSGKRADALHRINASKKGIGV